MYKKYKVNILKAGKDYLYMLKKMLPGQDESKALERKALKRAFDKCTQEERQDNELFEAMVQKELEALLIEKKKYRESLTVIKTARTESEINEHIDKGYTALIKQVVPSDKIKVLYSLEQDNTTGKVTVLSDDWDIYSDPKNAERPIDRVYYYPYQFPSPFAAYMIPAGLKIGERVILDDLIEDVIGNVYKSSTYRLDSCEAIWNGEAFLLDHNSYETEMTLG